MGNRPTYPSLRGVLRDLSLFKRNWDARRITQEEKEIAEFLGYLGKTIEKLAESDRQTGNTEDHTEQGSCERDSEKSVELRTEGDGVAGDE